MTDRWKRLVPPVAGVALVAGLVAAVIIGNTPDAGSSGTKVVNYFTSHHGRTNADVVLLAYSSLMAVVFYTGMATYMRSRGADMLATITVVGGAILATGLGIAAGATEAVNDHTSKLSTGAAQALNNINEDIFFVAVFGGLALATLAMGISFLRTNAMPKALGIITVIVGVVAVSGIGSWFGFMGAGVLNLVLAGYLYQRTGRPESITIPDVPDQRAAEPATPKRSRAKA
jgi:hypothetical protein